jgi:hypothetical protein
VLIEKTNDLIGNRTRDLPACSTVPQPTAPLRAPNKEHKGISFNPIVFFELLIYEPG